jgi:hypothetical protein
VAIGNFLDSRLSCWLQVKKFKHRGADASEVPSIERFQTLAAEIKRAGFDPDNLTAPGFARLS